MGGFSSVGLSSAAASGSFFLTSSQTFSFILACALLHLGLSSFLSCSSIRCRHRALCGLASMPPVRNLLHPSRPSVKPCFSESFFLRYVLRALCSARGSGSSVGRSL